MAGSSTHHGRRAAVVGGTHGIGLAIAEELVRGGAEVLVTGRSPATVATAQETLGPAARVVVSDVTDPADLDALAGQAGDLDALFVNVGIAELAELSEVTEDHWDRQFGVNAKGAFFAAQRLAPRVRPGGGIVFTTLMAKPASPGEAVVLATKAAVRAFSRVLAAELVTRGVRVNTVAPGFIDTPTLGVPGFSDDERAELRRAGRDLTPMQRLGAPAEVARAAVFLALEATFTTGTELQVDGGLSEIDVPAAAA